MRKLTLFMAAATVIAAGGAVTAAVADSPTAAAPLPLPCGSFAGSGPAPDCVYVLDGRSLQISLRNTATAPVPVVCNLLWPLADRPLSTTTMGAGERGSLSTTAAPGVQRYTVDCRSTVPVGDAVRRSVVLTLSVPGYAAPAPVAPTAPRWTPPKPTSTWRPPPKPPTVTQMPPALTQMPSARPNRTPNPCRWPRPARPTTDPTTTVPRC
ncbi:hypothetical protein ACWDTI_18430 [Gordonia sp. NPDC003424]